MRNRFKKIIHYYSYNMKLRSKFMISHLILVIIPTLVIVLAFYGQFYDMIVTNTINSEQALSEQTVTTIETTLSQVTTTSSIILDIPYIKDLFESEESPVSTEFANSSETKSFVNSTLVHQRDTVITNVKIYVDDPYLELTKSAENAAVFEPLKNARGSYWHGIMNSSDITTLYCPPFYLSPNEVTLYGGLAYIHRINYENTSNVAAYAVVYFSSKAFDSILEKDISVTNSLSYITNEREAIIGASDHSLIGRYYMSYNTILNSIKAPKNYITKSVLDVPVYVGYYEIAESPWIFVSILPAEPILSKGRTLVFQIGFIYLVFLTLAFVIAITLSHSITNRISSVVKQMQSVRSRSGKLKRMKSSSDSDEIADLVDTYNYMSNEINTLIDKQTEDAEAIKTSEFKALQSQINPHFLYNSLDMINWLSKTGKADEISNAIQALSKFYKRTLSNKDILSTVREEVTHVSLYIELQNMRFQNKIHFFVDIPDEFLDASIPKLTFQPIIENSILHGIFELNQKEGNVVITGWAQDNTIIISISDNGVGMTKEQISTILSGESKQGSGSNIGVYNTHTRLQLLYGKQYGLTYSSIINIGTDVEIHLPFNSN